MENVIKKETDSHFIKKLNPISIIISIIGFGVSLYALIVHIQLLMNSSGAAMCDFNAKVSCSVVIGSSYGEFASIPLGAYGMTYFAILLSASIMPRIANINKKWLATVELFLASIGITVVIILAYISYTVLQITCPTCSVIHALIVVYFVTKLLQYIKLKNETKKSQHDALTRLMAVCLCLGIPPLASGLLAPLLVDYFKPQEASKVKAETQSTANSSSQTDTQTATLNDLKRSLLTFNKTNFVGNGEDYRRGSDSAKVIVQMFSDYGCPHCRIATEAIMKAQDIVGINKVLYIYRFFPISNKCNPYIPSAGVFEYTCTLTEATRCAGQQGKFWEFKSWAFSGQFWSDAQRAENFSINGLTKEAALLGINSDQFTQCVQGNVELQKIKDDAHIANQLNIQGTPMIFINGEEYTGAHSIDAFANSFNQMLKN
ncbi:vitamin K epoxide reductase family protein [Fluviispira multicolorata]|nr:vitamin K epoxide reductase family protein [Fluviispira multicolorata]